MGGRSPGRVSPQGSVARSLHCLQKAVTGTGCGQGPVVLCLAARNVLAVQAW
jgi:hypothetical protein